MTGVVKFGKKLLQDVNVINTGTGVQPVIQTPVAPPPAPVPPLNALQTQPAAEVPTLGNFAQLAQKKIAAFEAANTGRAATILTRRDRRSRQSSGGAGQPPATYTNTVLGQ